MKSPDTPVVVYNGEQRGTAATDVRHLFAPVPEELLGYLPRHRYLLIDIQALAIAAKVFEFETAEEFVAWLRGT